ncbi:hypothetical protein AVEN_207797-1 [Araneus ventricosus]|uniref:Uncharacterized protein n=1 Tax=Araneus ventricosus TaxID=182803 RepID=A0A4Y2BXH5_ARAVE|nr:hypothetical protein AVEN_207797-1 [Araneus ventricosus]
MSSSKCNGACTRADGQDLLAWQQFLLSCLNDLFGLNNPVCVTRGALFLLIFLFLAFYEGLPFIISFVLAYVAFFFIGGKEHTVVMARTVPRDLR